MSDDAPDIDYARPIHGLIDHVDVIAREVVSLEDNGIIVVSLLFARED